MIPHLATLGPAPASVRWARVIAPLVMCFAYLTLRVAPATHERIPLGELLASGVLFVGLTFLAFIALGDALYPPTAAERETDDAAWEDRQAAHEEVETAPEDRFDWGRIEGDLLATLGSNWPGRVEAKAELIRRAYGYAPAEAHTEELELLTHEFHPQHHTPARGMPAVEWPEQVADNAEALMSWAEYDAGQTRTERRTGGRHRKAGA